MTSAARFASGVMSQAGQRELGDWQVALSRRRPPALEERWHTHGGADEAVAKARRSFEAGDLRWAAEVLDQWFLPIPGTPRPGAC